jgi:hypothetical protein
LTTDHIGKPRALMLGLSGNALARYCHRWSHRIVR